MALWPRPAGARVPGAAVRGKIVKLESSVYAGDWHDRPLKWAVEFERSQFTRNFATKAHARAWARIVRVLWRAGFNACSAAYIALP